MEGSLYYFHRYPESMCYPRNRQGEINPMEQNKELESRIEEVLKAEKENKIPRMTKRDYIIAAVITAISLLGIIGGFFL